METLNIGALATTLRRYANELPGDELPVLLVLLCHKSRAGSVPHHGQCGRAARMDRMCRQRMLVMEPGLCRSGRTGSAPWAEIFG
jgi:hypothetical protein